MSKKLTLIAYSVREREGQKAVWTRIGAAWPHGPLLLTTNGGNMTGSG
jgi:hypothetical protein